VRDAEGATLVFVYAPAEKRVYSRRVAVGSPIDREIEITQGLEAGDLVVVAGQERMRDGASVTATVEQVPSGPARTIRQTTSRGESSR
jgi:multidrug efflux pump subunit AcrA (membrane-fusion protein)